METPAVTRYLDATYDRLVRDGSRVHNEKWYGYRVIVGYRSERRLAWMGYTLHLFAIVSTVPHVSERVISGFADTAMKYALQLKGAERNLHTTVGVLPCLVSPVIEPAAVDWVEKNQLCSFGVLTRSVVVDPGHGMVASLQANPLLGRIFDSHLRGQIATYVPAAGPVPHQPYR